MIPPGVIDEKLRHWGELITPERIRALASRVHHMARIGRVHNETGMFVTMVNEAVAEHIGAWERSQSPPERERHALFMVEMLRCASQKATPLDIAGCIRAARSKGFPMLDEYLMLKLEVMGDLWDRSV